MFHKKIGKGKNGKLWAASIQSTCIVGLANVDVLHGHSTLAHLSWPYHLTPGDGDVAIQHRTVHL